MRWVDASRRLTIDQARDRLTELVKGIWQLGIRGGPQPIGEHEVEVVVLSVDRHELIMDLLEKHGGLRDLQVAELQATPAWEDVEKTAADLELPAVGGKPEGGPTREEKEARVKDLGASE
jgi:hypothetical protein